MNEEQLALLNDDELELQNPEELEDGSLEFEINDPSIEADIDEMLLATEHYSNLLPYLDEGLIDECVEEIRHSIEADIEERTEWADILREGLAELGLKSEDCDAAFDGGSIATHPMLLESIVKFQSRSLKELLPSKGPVKTKIIGQETPEKIMQAHRVKQFMNYQVQEMMPEYEAEADKLFFYLGFAGTAIKKTYYDPGYKRPVSLFVRAEDFIVPYDSPRNLEFCKRYTHQYTITRKRYDDFVRADFFEDNITDFDRQVSLSDFQDEERELHGFSNSDADETIKLWECHVECEFEPDVGPAPYIVIMAADSDEVLSIRRNWREDDENYKKRLYFSDYHFVPGFGWYSYGLVHLIGGLSKAATITLRQLNDAGTFANLPAGFKAHGIRTTGPDEPLKPGTFREVNAPTGDISKALIPLPFKEPSPTLFNLLQFIVTAGEKFSDSTQEVLKDSSSYGPVGTIMQLLESSGHLFNAIHRRMHKAQALDFKILAELNYEWLPSQYPYEVVGNSVDILRNDFDGRIDVVPVSDPNMPTQAHRLARANALATLSLQFPQHANLREVYTEVLQHLEFDEPQKFLQPPPQQAQPADPITENQALVKGEPVKAGPAQHHMAHIKAHHAFMQMPMVAKNPMAQNLAMAHIQEHVALDYRVKVEALLGQPLPPPGQPLPPELESQIAVAAAEATVAIVQEDVMQEIMKDPQFQIALEGFAVERERIKVQEEDNLRKNVLEYEKLNQEAVQNELDRASDEKQERIKLQGRGQSNNK